MYKPYDNNLDALNSCQLIRSLNDAFRTESLTDHPLLTGNKLLITRGVADRGNNFVARAVKAVQEFSNFTENNDPHGEHDFGSFELDGIKLFWKIDYYDRELEWGSPEPADPAVTRRVLTILLAHEY
jgi:Protein of unknown function (DUF3768)